jgi:hypothetical protein
MVQIERLGFGKGDGLKASHQFFVLAGDPHFVHGFVDNRFEGGGELIGGLGHEGGRLSGFMVEKDHASSSQIKGRIPGTPY